MLKIFARNLWISLADLKARDRLSLTVALLLWIAAIFAIDALFYRAQAHAAGGTAFFRVSDQEPSRISVLFEKKCSFAVIKLAPGTYQSEPSVQTAVAKLWTDADARTKNIWLYAHRDGECRAAAGSVGYRYTWTTNTDALVQNSVVATGNAHSVVSDGRIYLIVSKPIWLSGDIASAIQFSRVTP